MEGHFCYVLTARQMGKSSLMVRSAFKLREHGFNVVVLDLTAIGQNLTPEQWYDGMTARMAQQLRLEQEIEEARKKWQNLSPVQRWITHIREIVLVHRPQPMVVFIDEIDTVRSLPFSPVEFFAAIRECYNRRTEDPMFARLTFCLFGVATPAELIRDQRTTPFNMGQRIDLTDFTAEEARPLAKGWQVNLGPDAGNQADSRDELPAIEEVAQNILNRILHWTRGHPYLTQRLCRSVAEAGINWAHPPSAVRHPDWIDHLCEQLFLSPRAREQDDNLLYVRERILRSETDLASLLDLYEQVHNGQFVQDDETNDLINQLRLAGIVRVDDGRLKVRNPIYERVFDKNWINANMPYAELEKSDGGWIRIKGTCTIGRSPSNEIVLPHDTISRNHALIQAQKQNEFWLVDLGSSNGTFLNGQRVKQAVLLHDQDQILIGQFCLIFHQAKGNQPAPRKQAMTEKTILQKTKPDN
jgi:hypothetical protein